MVEPGDLHNTWLVAAWPGMGHVGVGGVGYLVEKLGASLVHELPPGEVFDVDHINVENGIASAGRLPRSMCFEWRDPAGRHDLLLFRAEAQPSVHGYAMCRDLLDYATARGVERVFTLAAMASQLHPSDSPRTFGVATDRAVLNELREQDVEILNDGQISGLNGVLLAAAAERKIPGVCLLGELPFFAASVANPRASHAVLDVFSNMAGIDVDFTDILEQARTVEKGLLQMLEKMKEAARQQAEDQDEEGFTIPEFEPEDDDPGSEKARQETRLSDAVRRRIEVMFKEAEQDRSKAFLLKEELDRLSVFERYEDRFLDLFKKGE